jgi:hypothetical protein
MAELQELPAQAAVGFKTGADEAPHPSPPIQVGHLERPAIGEDEGRRPVITGDPELGTELQTPANIRTVGQVAHAPSDHRLAGQAGGQELLADPRLPGGERLAREQLAQALEVVVVGLAGEGSGEAAPAGQGGIDLLPCVVVLENDAPPPGGRRQPSETRSWARTAAWGAGAGPRRRRRHRSHTN